MTGLLATCQGISCGHGNIAYCPVSHTTIKVGPFKGKLIAEVAEFDQTLFIALQNTTHRAAYKLRPTSQQEAEVM